MCDACHIYFNKKQNLPRGIKKPHKRLRFSVKTVVGDEGGVSLFIMQIKTKPPVIAFHFDKIKVQIVKNALLILIIGEIEPILRRCNSMCVCKCPTECRGRIEARCR